jgi:BASS family bile acid:Na+ symporter
MAIAKIVILALQVSIFLLVFSLGLRTTWRDATSLFKRPAKLVRAAFAMLVVAPVVAALLAGLFHLHPAVKLALIFLAVSPMPPLIPQKQLKLGATAAYVNGMLTAISLLSIVFVPIAIEILGKIFGQDVHIGPLAVANVVGRTILLPLGLGILVHARAPAFAQRTSTPLGRIANVLLLLTAVPLLIFAIRPVMSLVGHGEVLAMIALAVVAVAVGHWLGGPDLRERSTLAMDTASRHPGMALAIAAANFPEDRRLVAAAIVLYLLVSTVVLLPYDAWCRRRLARSLEPTGPQQKAA